MTDQTIFERCVVAADASSGAAGAYDTAAVTRSVIQTIIDNTPSLRTAEELTRILGEA